MDWQRIKRVGATRYWYNDKKIDSCSKESNVINVPFLNEGYKPFNHSVLADMSAHWNSGLKGGAAKVAS